ncbi:MAG: TRAP transporter substrate-binding protein [Acidimicrobiia bacterium]|nr:TRAP transporter substrate-binding protein [Acidimicrobiia bacterium]
MSLTINRNPKKLLTDTRAARASRRRFLAAAAAVPVAAMSAPAIVNAQAQITLRFQSTWPPRFIYHEFALDWTKKVSELTGGRLKIDMLAAGAVVPGLQVIEATNSGVLDGAHGIPGFWFGKNTAFGLYGAGPDFGMDPNQLLGWCEYGGGKELYAEIQAAAKLDIVSFLFGPVPCEPMGWFKKEIRTVDDLKGLKFRTAGLAVDMFKELGMSTVQLAPADIVPSIERGVLDGAEFASATDDRVMGFPDVAKFYMQQSYHMSNNFCEVMFNKKRYDALPAEIKSILPHAAHAASADMHWKAMHRMSKDLIEVQTVDKVKVSRTPRVILDAQLKAWDKVIERRSAENPLFAKVIGSQKAWARRVMYWHNTVQVDQRAAYAHYFPKGPLD